MSNASQIQQQITSTAQQYGVNPALALAVANAESGYNPNAVSSAGAIGIFQLMPSTAAGLGVNPYDTAQNINGGVQYLSQLLTQYNGNTALALAAYNAGPGAVAKYGGIPPYSETQSYVSGILATIGVPVAASYTTDASDEYDDSGASVDTGFGTLPSDGMWLLAAAAVIGAVYWLAD